MARPSPTATRASTPVLAVLVCHDGETWLPGTLDALSRLTRRPRWVVAVDTGSADGTAGILAASNQVDVVLRMPRDTGFAEAVHTAVDDADRRWGRTASVGPRGEHAERGSGDWLWVLHDDAAPAPDCLQVLLSVAEASPSAAVLGPLCLDWDDPRLVVEAGVSIDASGSRQTGIGADELDLGQFATNSEVLAVGSAGSLVRRREWDSLGGYDTALGLLREDVDYGWRVNRAGGLVLCAPSARLRHARALTTRARPLDTAGVDPRYRATDRAHGVRTFLANCSSPAFVLGLLRLPVLAVLRALGLLLVRRARAAGAELAGLSRVLGSGPGIADLADARRRRSTGATALPRELRGLLTSRTTRLRNAVRGGLTSLVRGRLREELELGRLPEWAERSGRTGGPDAEGGGDADGRRRAVGPEALPAGAALRRRRTAGLRRPGESLAVALPGPRAPADDRPAAASAAPAPAGAPVADPPTEPGERVVYVPVTPGRVARELLLAPPLLLVVGLTLVSLVTQRARLGLDLAGGRIAEVPGLRELWSTYLAGWHPIAGGTGAPVPAALAVVGVLGGPAWPVGGPPAAVSLLLVAALPLAGLSAYLATRELRVGRVLRALAAAVYALLGITAGAVAQGRLDGVVAVVLLPLVLAGVVAVLRGVRTAGRRGSWWSTAAGTALALGIVSAFAPLVHVLVLVVVVIGFVLVPAPPRAAGRRAMSLAVIVVLPVLLLLPWPTVLLAAPEVLLHGTGSTVPERFVSALDVLSLDPGGPATLPWTGLVLVVAAVGGALVAPRRAAVPGLALLLLGIVAAGVVGSFALAPLAGGDPRPGWTGPALAVAACGALWSLLAQVAASRTEPLGRLLGRGDPADRADRGPARRGESELDLGGAGLGGRLAGAVERAGAGASLLAGRLRSRAPGAGDPSARARGVAVPVVATAVVVLAVATVLRGGAGPLADAPAPALDRAVAADLARSGARVVVVTREEDTTRRAGPELPRYGDDDLAPVGASPARLQRDVRALLSGDPATAQAGVAELATGGTGLVVLPDEQTARAVRTAAGPLLGDAPPVSDGRPTARVALPVAGAVLLEPPVSDDATEARAAPRRPAGLTTVPSDLPTVAVRVSPGADRRLLVVAAELESGWSATVGGVAAPVVPAWGHLVGVAVPPGGGAVVVDRDETTRLLLLLLQLALVLFTALSALPSRRRLD
ncbi:glycosyltransferase family 2 protein [Actinomycetospora lemnae]|uniref:Glycosyltransferase family 2 protein n=1 Tax=Actinomycetospora lemnae TaxID=3019891 RepID=A0ABT5SPS5_9PSEU|nr:glycosyltransferase family 2 protein [Actinomycetospora sp. DW7H6]MDD7963783.1 glycosyltransferase family 2 protein [Actinomycetospora sp. DW7H6]